MITIEINKRTKAGKAQPSQTNTSEPEKANFLEELRNEL